MGDLRAVATIGALTTADTADLRAVATGGFLTTDAGNSAQLTDTLGAGEALLIAKSGDADNAEGAGFSESLTVTAGYKVSLADGLGGGEALASVRHGIPVALSTQTLLSDVAQMADGTVWIGHYSSEGIDAPLLRVESYTQSYVGLCGDRAVYETTAQVTEEAGPSAGNGILSLHPDGYALCEGNADDLLHLWRYAAGVWTLAAVGAAEDDTTLAPGSYRLEVIDGTLYALPVESTLTGYALRGSVLQPINWADPLLPVALAEYRSISTPFGAGWTGNRARACRWRNRWLYYDWATMSLRRAGDDWQADLSTYSEFPPMLLSDGSRVIMAGTGLASYHGWDVQAVGGQPAYPETLVGQATVLGASSAATAELDFVPVAGRVTDGQAWALGFRTVDLWESPRFMDTPFLRDWLGRSARLFAIGALTERVCILSATLEWAQARAVPNVLAATLEWSTGVGSSKPSVTDATLEWADGSSTNKPTLTAATLEWSSDLRPSLLSATLEWAEDHARAALTAATLEWATGAGTERPSITAATLEWSAGAGSSKPTVTSATLEWAEQPVTPYLLEATLEWAQVVTTSETVGVCWVTQAAPGALVNAVRLTEVALDSGYTWIVRTDDAAPVEAYGSYTELTPYVLTEVPPGSMVRLGVIGPLADPVPAAILQLYCEPTAI